MKKKNLKLIVSTILISMLSIALVSCSNGGSGEGQSLVISGSSALLPLMEVSIESFNEEKSEVAINAQAGGSGTGLTQVSEGTVDIGNSDVAAEDKLDEAAAKELTDNKVVAQGFAVVVSKDLGVDNLTKEELKGVFSGKIKNWSEVGGPNKEIFVIHRPASSGTRGTFTTTILDGDKSLEDDSIGATQDSNGAVLTAMGQNEGGISYLALSYLNSDDAKSKILKVSIDGVEAEKENIITGKYPFWSWGHMYTKGETKDISKEFIEFIMSDENKENVEKLGFISGSEMKIQD